MIDKYAGQGGDFEIDPKTGEKKLIRQTLPAQQTESLPQEETSDAKEDQTKSLARKGRKQLWN